MLSLPPDGMVSMSVITDRQKLTELSKSLPADQHANVDVAALLGLAQQAVQRHELGHAEQILQGALVVDPDSAPAWGLLGKVEHALGAEPAAIEAYANAVMLNDADLATALALAELHAATGAPEKARALANWLLLACEDEPELLKRTQTLVNKLQRSSIG